MRIRSIKPQFFLDSKILDLPPLARLLFIGLWCCADREGRMHYDPRELRRQVLPDETQSVFDEMFGALTASNLIRLYAVENSSYVDIPHFLAHQVPYHKEQPSVIPSHDGSRPGKGRVKTRTRKGQDRSGAGVVIGAGEEGSTTLVRPRRSNGARVAPTGIVKPSPLTDPEQVRRQEEDFITLYQFYPRHVGKESAWKAFIRLDPDVDTLREIARDIKKRTDEGEWVPGDPERVRFIPHLASYLNQRRWTDER